MPFTKAGSPSTQASTRSIAMPNSVDRGKQHAKTTPQTTPVHLAHSGDLTPQTCKHVSGRRLQMGAHIGLSLWRDLPVVSFLDYVALGLICI